MTLYCVTHRDGRYRFQFCFFSDAALQAFLRNVQAPTSEEVK